MFQVQDIIDKYLGSPSSYKRRSEPNERYYFCPKCQWKNPRLSVDYGKNVFHCWYCNWGGKSLTNILYELNANKEDINELKDIFGEKIKDKKHESSISDIKSRLKNITSKDSFKKYSFYQKTNDTIIVPDSKTKDLREFKSISKNKNLFSGLAKKYLKTRGIQRYEIDYYNIHYNSDSILFPNYDVNGELNYWVRRTVEGKFYEIPDKSEIRKSDIIFFDRLIDYSKPVNLVEGIFDAINLGFNTIPMLGTFVNKQIIEKLVEHDTPYVIIFLDSDAYETAEKVANYLKTYGIKSYVVVNYGYSDPAEVPRNKVKMILNNNLKTIDKINIKI